MASMKNSKNIVLLAVSLLLGLVAAEVLLRTFSTGLATIWDEKNLSYRYDATLGWFPVENRTTNISTTRTYAAKNNSRGFRDIEHLVDNKPRIICIGDSFVWGFDVEQHERFTERLRDRMPDYSIYNLGVSGYGTDQEYILLKQQIEFYRPKIVVLVIVPGNDLEDNSADMRYGLYYKPYLVESPAGLQIRGVPVPVSPSYTFAKYKLLSHSYLFRMLVIAYHEITAMPAVAIADPTFLILSEMDHFTKSKGAKLFVGLQQRHQEIERFLTSAKIPFVDLTNPYTYSSWGNHWTPEGHTYVSEKIHKMLTGEDVSRKP